jgi:hypothetical protein
MLLTEWRQNGARPCVLDYGQFKRMNLGIPFFPGFANGFKFFFCL